MKKYLKLVSVLLLSLLICLSFCSCFDVEGMREAHAKWGNAEKTIIKFQGEEYKLLPKCDALYVAPSEDSNNGYVTDSDVPVLLSESYGWSIVIGRDAEMLVAGIWEDDYNCNRVFCRSDLYEAKVNAIENFELNAYCIYDPIVGRSVSQYRLLKDKTIAAINLALSGEGVEMDSFNRSGEGIYTCDKTMQFIGNADKGASMWVTYIGGKACVVVENFNTSTKVYKFIRYDISEENVEQVMTDIKPLVDRYDYEMDYYN